MILLYIGLSTDNIRSQRNEVMIGEMYIMIYYGILWDICMLIIMGGYGEKV